MPASPPLSYRRMCTDKYYLKTEFSKSPSSGKGDHSHAELDEEVILLTELAGTEGFPFPL